MRWKSSFGCSLDDQLKRKTSFYFSHEHSYACLVKWRQSGGVANVRIRRYPWIVLFVAFFYWSIFNQSQHKKMCPIFNFYFQLAFKKPKKWGVILLFDFKYNNHNNKNRQIFHSSNFGPDQKYTLEKKWTRGHFFFFCLTWKFDNEHYWSYASLLAIHKWSFFIFWVRNLIKFQNGHILEGRQLIRFDMFSFLSENSECPRMNFVWPLMFPLLIFYS